MARRIEIIVACNPYALDHIGFLLLDLLIKAYTQFKQSTGTITSNATIISSLLAVVNGYENAGWINGYSNEESDCFSEWNYKLRTSKLYYVAKELLYRQRYQQYHGNIDVGDGYSKRNDLLTFCIIYG